jgi:hypothetical protein
MTSASAAAATAYDALADTYEDLTKAYDYETWLSRLVAVAERHGLRGRRLLDVACGTGKSFAPMLERGYRVTGCDVRPSTPGPLRPDHVSRRFPELVNSLLTYRTSFADTWVRPSPDSVIAWHGHASPAHSSGTTASATITVFRSRDGVTWSRQERARTAPLATSGPSEGR